MTFRPARHPQPPPRTSSPTPRCPTPLEPAADPTRDRDDASARPLVFANGFALSPYAETGAPGGSLKTPPRTLWHASPGSTNTPK